MTTKLKALLFVGVLAVAGILTAGVGYGPRTGGTAFEKQLTESSSAYPGRDNTVKVFVRFDDGRDDVAKRAGTGAEGTGIGYSFARRGLPFGLALNNKNLGGPGDMTVAEVQNLLDYADSKGSQVEIMQHGNTNFGSIGASYALWDTFQSYQRLLDELNPVGLEANFGRDVTAFVSPGDGGEANGVPGFIASNYGVIKPVLNDYGIKYAQWGLTSSVHGLYSIVPAITGGVEDIGSINSQNIGNTIRPGMVMDPHNFPENFTIDLGAQVIERDASDIDCSCDDWTISANTTIDPGTARTFSDTFRWFYSRRLGGRMGFGIALHDSMSSQNTLDELGPDGASYPASANAYAGSWSPDAVAAILKKLEDQGFIDVVTPSEWFDWMMGSYARGTDLVDNNQALIPHMEIGDSVGIDAPFPMGWVVTADESQAFGAQNELLVAGWVEDPGTEGQITDYYTSTTVGPDVAGYGGGGVQGGGFIKWTFANLPPGRYLFTTLSDNQSTTLQSRDSWILGKAKYQEFETAWTNAHMSAWQDTFFVLQGSDVAGAGVLNAGLGTGDIVTPRFEFHLPRDLPSFNTDYMSALVDRQWSGANGRVWVTDPLYAVVIVLNYFGADKVSHVHLWYLGE